MLQKKALTVYLHKKLWKSNILSAIQFHNVPLSSTTYSVQR